MLKDINELRNKRLEFIRDFLNECSIKEKIDTYYVSVEIISKNNIIFKKSNGREIDRSDMILNSMWDKFKNDWNYFRMVNDEWFSNHIGYKIFMFFFPCKKPILTEYKDNITYIIDRIVYGTTTIEPETLMTGMKMIDDFNIKFNKKLKKNEFDTNIIAERIYKKDSSESVESIFLNEVINQDDIFAQDRPEGYVLKKGKHIYQLSFDNKADRIVVPEKSQYEFLLNDFMRYWNQHELWMTIDNSYIKSVCLMFNSYILNKEQPSNFIRDNINITSIMNPYIGKRFPMNYDYIPDKLTVTLCQENELYENIFKVLLVNMKHEKKVQHCILMDYKNVEEWNGIVKNMMNRCLSE